MGGRGDDEGKERDFWRGDKQIPPKGREREIGKSERKIFVLCFFDIIEAAAGPVSLCSVGCCGNAKVQGDEKALLFAKEEEER